MVIHKENKNVGVLGRILSHQLMFLFFQRTFPANPVHKTNCSLYFLSEVDVSVHICGDGLSSLIQNFFSRESACCIKCFQPSFPQRFELLYFFPSPDMTSPLHSLPRAKFSTRQWPSHAFSIFCEPSLFRWAWQQKISIVTKGGALFRDRKHRAGSSFLPCLSSTWGFSRLKWAIAAHCWREENLHSPVHSDGIDSKWENLGFLSNCGCWKWNSSHVLAGHSFSSCRSIIPVTP